MNFKFIPFRAEHIKMIDIPAGEENPPEELYRMGLEDENSHMYTIVSDADESIVVGFGGMTILWSGVAECYSVRSKHIKIYPVAYMKVMHEIIDFFFKEFGLHRLQCGVLDNFDNGKRWIELIGFESEGLMRAFTDQAEDMWRYAIVRGS